MEFGPVPTCDALGAILAHSMALPDGRLRKGRVLTEADVARIAEAGVGEVTVARLAPGDVGEDAAATRLAAALVPDPTDAGLRIGAAGTGRVNIYAAAPGVLLVDAQAIGALNRVDAMITLATLSPLTRVAPRQMVATVKIISYAVPEAALKKALEAAHSALSMRPPVRTAASLILTETDAHKESQDSKGARAVAARLKRLGVELAETRVVPHETDALAAAIGASAGDVVLILTASATSDIRDVAPAAVTKAGGEVARFGMPVDPGNLLFLGVAANRPVIGLPGCARSPALNGADWVIERVLCGIEVSDADIASMGVGGLLKESPARPHPREREKKRPR